MIQDCTVSQDHFIFSGARGAGNSSGVEHGRVSYDIDPRWRFAHQMGCKHGGEGELCTGEGGVREAWGEGNRARWAGDGESEVQMNLVSSCAGGRRWERWLQNDGWRDLESSISAMAQFWVIMRLGGPLWEQVAGVERRSRSLGLGKLVFVFFLI